MKYLIYLFSLFFLFNCKVKKADAPVTEIHWMSIEEAASMKNPKKKFFVDVYTHWCGWCKKMDRTTFKDPKVISVVGNQFYFVKFDAEQRTPMTWKGKEYNFVEGRRHGYNELAKLLLNGRLQYPSYAILDENLDPVKVIVGYRRSEQFINALEPYK